MNKRTRGALSWMMDCRRCQKDRTVEQRRDVGCAYEDAKPGADVWCPPGYNTDVHERPTICAGYLCGLPDVIATAVLHRYLERGGLAIRADGHLPDAAKAMLDAMDGQAGAAETWAHEEDDRERRAKAAIR